VCDGLFVCCCGFVRLTYVRVSSSTITKNNMYNNNNNTNNVDHASFSLWPVPNVYCASCVKVCVCVCVCVMDCLFVVVDSYVVRISSSTITKNMYNNK